MPVTSTVQTPELFKGTLKEYQMKGLQWLVNCYEQVHSISVYICYFCSVGLNGGNSSPQKSSFRMGLY